MKTEKASTIRNWKGSSQRLSISLMRSLARNKGGKCLSKIYLNARTKLLWQCKKGHRWYAQPSHIREGVWCPVCAIQVRADKERSSIEDMRKIARKRGGLCLSNLYVVSGTKLKWKCKNGHVWEARPNSIVKGGWCPYCARRAKLGIKTMREIAKSRGGFCLSHKYFNAKTKLKWRCKNGHVWYSMPDHIVNQGSWCPRCAAGIGERACRKVFEGLLGTSFPKTRTLRWLVNSRGNMMELDGYSERLGLAFEYQGQQHYSKSKMFHRNRSLATQKADDIQKRILCRGHRITLIEIPFEIDLEELPDYIAGRLKAKKIPLHGSIKKVKQSLMSIYSPEKLEEIKSIALSRGGKCLSSHYLGSNSKLQFKCKDGHIWDALPSNIKRGKWCPRCAMRRSAALRTTIQEIQLLAKEKGGKCLSKKYTGFASKLKWMCKYGHIWETRLKKIKHGYWCPECYRKSVSDKKMESMQKLAGKRGGRCLSNTYVSGEKLKWRCDKGHVWEALPTNIKKGSWCPVCSGHAKLSINDMQQIAKKHGGKCLSKRYLGNHIKLIWRCKKGHIWKAIPSNVKRGSWCPYCFGHIKSTIKEICSMAKLYGGKCLSKKYKNANAQMKWRCKKGHIWYAGSSYIRQGYWCPICHKASRRTST